MMPMVQNLSNQYDTLMSALLSNIENHAAVNVKSTLIENLLYEASQLGARLAQCQRKMDCMDKYIGQLYAIIFKMSNQYAKLDKIVLSECDASWHVVDNNVGDTSPLKSPKRIVTIEASFTNPVYKFYAGKLDTTFVEPTLTTYNYIVGGDKCHKYTLQFVYSDLAGCELYTFKYTQGGFYANLQPHIMSQTTHIES
ncbi:hypothetical protein F-VV10_0098 [Faustovirus]|nr:hypothetical protein F-VV10_0098 [Faustovirus]